MTCFHLPLCVMYILGVRSPRLPGYHHPKAQVYRVFFLPGRAVPPHRLQYLGEDAKLNTTLMTVRLDRFRHRRYGTAGPR